MSNSSLSEFTCISPESKTTITTTNETTKTTQPLEHYLLEFPYSYLKRCCRYNSYLHGISMCRISIWFLCVESVGIKGVCMEQTYVVKLRNWQGNKADAFNFILTRL